MAKHGGFNTRRGVCCGDATYYSVLVGHKPRGCKDFGPRDCTEARSGCESWQILDLRRLVWAPPRNKVTLRSAARLCSCIAWIEGKLPGHQAIFYATLGCRGVWSTQACIFSPTPSRVHVEFGKGTSIYSSTVHKRRPLQAPIFSVDFIVLGFGLWISALWRSV